MLRRRSNSQQKPNAGANMGCTCQSFERFGLVAHYYMFSSRACGRINHSNRMEQLGKSALILNALMQSDSGEIPFYGKWELFFALAFLVFSPPSSGKMLKCDFAATARTSVVELYCCSDTAPELFIERSRLNVKIATWNCAVESSKFDNFALNAAGSYLAAF